MSRKTFEAHTLIKLCMFIYLDMFITLRNIIAVTYVVKKGQQLLANLKSIHRLLSKMLTASDKEILKAGNLNSAPSLDVLNKISSENRSKYDLDCNGLTFRSAGESSESDRSDRSRRTLDKKIKKRGLKI